MKFKTVNFVKVIILASAVAIFADIAFAGSKSPLGEKAEVASASTSGDGYLISGPNPYNLRQIQPLRGSAQFIATEPVNPKDQDNELGDVEVFLEFSADGSVYQISIDKTMPAFPFGEAPWLGLSYHAQLATEKNKSVGDVAPAPELMLWGWAKVSKDGEIIAEQAPSKFIVLTQKPLRGIAFDVKTAQSQVGDNNEGYLHVYWPHLDTVDLPVDGSGRTKVAGLLALASFNLIFWRKGGRDWLTHQNPGRFLGRFSHKKTS